MSGKSDKARSEFILRMISNIETITSRHGSFAKAVDDEAEGRPAVLMNLLQIGEALNKIDPDLRERFELTTEARGAYDVRNFIAHDYMGVNLKIVETVIEESLPELKRKVSELQSFLDKNS